MLAVFVTVVTLFVVFWVSFSAYKTLSNTVPHAVQMQGFHGDIEHLDEILTLSAKLGAASGDARWIDRYKKAERRLVDSVRGAIDQSQNKDILLAARRIDESNIELIDMEEKSFALVRAGDRDAAMSILSSENYAKEKQAYHVGVVSLLAAIKMDTQGRIDEQRVNLKLLLWSIPMVLLGLALLWYLVFRSLQRWRLELKDQQYHRAVAESQVKRINRELEQRIAVRTSELQESERRFHRLAHYDDLTSLPNRRSGIELLSQVLSEVTVSSPGVGVMLVDLDDFKRVNDSLGHGIGDSLLVHVARRIKNSVRENDHVFRLGGDEFLVVSDFTRGEVTEAKELAGRVLECFSEPFSIGNGRFELKISPSIGVAIAPEHGTDVEDLIRHADMAMYAAKYRGRNCYCVFNEEMNKQAMHQIDMESKLRAAMGQGQLSLHYQPQIDLSTGNIVGVEALLRWDLPGIGPIAPTEFIPLAESNGFIVEIGEWVLNEACRQVRQWKEQKGIDLVLAVNVSPVQLRQEGFFDAVMRILDTQRFDPTTLELELTETALLENADRVKQTLSQLRDAGVRLSLDDFGTGYSALSYLKRYNFDMLKLDRSYVDGMLKTERDARLVKAIISLAHGLDMQIVGEGTETLTQCDLLKSYGCDIAQGYYYSRPLPAPDLLDFLDGWNEKDFAVAS